MEELDIKDFLAYLKKYIWALIIIPIVAAAAVYYYDTQIKVPLYNASSQVALLQSDSSNAATTLSEINANQKLTSTYSVIAKSKAILDQVIFELDLNTTSDALAKNIKVSTISDTTILKMWGGSFQEIHADVPATIMNDRTFVPVRVVSEAFGAKVDWDANTKSVLIFTHGEG